MAGRADGKPSGSTGITGGSSSALSACTQAPATKARRSAGQPCHHPRANPVPDQNCCHEGQQLDTSPPRPRPRRRRVAESIPRHHPAAGDGNVNLPTEPAVQPFLEPLAAAARDRGRDRAQGTRAGSRDLRPRSTALSLAFELSVVTQAVQTPASSSRAANPTDVMAAHRRRFGPTGRILARREPTTTLAATSPARADHSSAGMSAHGPCARSSTSPAAAWTAPRTAAIRCRVRSRATAPATEEHQAERRAAIRPRPGRVGGGFQLSRGCGRGKLQRGIVDRAGWSCSAPGRLGRSVGPGPAWSGIRRCCRCAR